MRIAVDIDGVLADSVGALLPLMREKYGLPLYPEIIKEYDFKLGKFNLGKELVALQKESREFVMCTPAVAGAAESLTRIELWPTFVECEIVVVTARPAESVRATLDWLLQNDIPYGEFWNLSGYERSTLDCDVLIDDSAENILNFLVKTPAKAILFRQPWNRNCESLTPFIDSGRLRVAESWLEIPGIIGEWNESTGVGEPRGAGAVHAPGVPESGSVSLSLAIRDSEPVGVNPKDRIGDTKPQLHLIPASACILESLVLALGGQKYGPFNWRTKRIRGTVYASAMLRHLLAWIDGEDVDPESGLSHIAHIRAGGGILLDAMSLDSWIDDRPTRGAAADLIRQHTGVRA